MSDERSAEQMADLPENWHVLASQHRHLMGEAKMLRCELESAHVVFERQQKREASMLAALRAIASIGATDYGPAAAARMSEAARKAISEAERP